MANLSKVSGFVLPPGTDVLLERGSVFEDETLELMLPSGMTLGAYGNSTLPRPQIVRRTLPGTVTCVELVDPADVAVSGCTWRDAHKGSASVLPPPETPAAVPATSPLPTISFVTSQLMTHFSTRARARGHGHRAGQRVQHHGVTIQNNVGLRMDTFLPMQRILTACCSARTRCTLAVATACKWCAAGTAPRRFGLPQGHASSLLHVWNHGCHYWVCGW